MPRAAFLRVLALVIAVACAGWLVERVYVLAGAVPPVTAPPSAESPGEEDRPEPSPVLFQKDAGLPLRNYAAIAGGQRFRFHQTQASPAATGAAGEPDRFGDLTLVGIMWDESAGAGLASVTVSGGRMQVVAEGGRVGEYRVLEIDRHAAVVALGTSTRRLRPRPPLMEKTHSGTP